MLHALADPWSEPIMRRAFAEVVLLGIAGGALGCWVLFYNLSYSAESLAHSLLPGLVVAALLGLPLLLGGAVGIVVAAVAVAVVARTPAVGRDTAVAVVVTGLFGLGVLLALSPAEFTEPGKAVGGHARAADRQFVARLGEFALRFVPGAARHAD